MSKIAAVEVCIKVIIKLINTLFLWPYIVMVFCVGYCRKWSLKCLCQPGWPSTREINPLLALIATSFIHSKLCYCNSLFLNIITQQYLFSFFNADSAALPTETNARICGLQQFEAHLDGTYMLVSMNGKLNGTDSLELWSGLIKVIHYSFCVVIHCCFVHQFYSFNKCLKFNRKTESCFFNRFKYKM